MGNDDEKCSGKSLSLVNGTPDILNVHPNPSWPNCSGTHITDNQSILLNTWNQVICSVDAGTVTFYINGQQGGTYSGVESGGTNWFIGGKGINTTQFRFSGFLDDVRIYNRALSSNEVQQLYAIESQPPFLTNGLLAYYPFNGNANDASGNGVNGVQVGAPQLTADRFGVPNSAYHFNGGTDSIFISRVSVDTQPNAITTVTFWMNWDGTFYAPTDAGGFPFGWGNSSGVYHYGGAINPHPSPPVFGLIGNGSGDIFGTYVSSNALRHWIHVVAEFNNGDVKGGRVYTNGVAVGTSIYSSGFPSGGTFQTAVTTNAFISGFGGYTARYRFVGSIDDVRIYNRALSSNEVAQLYAYESTPFPPTPIQPAITSQPQSVTVHAHDSVSFSVLASGELPLAYQWSLNGTNISGATASSVTISNVTQNALGAFSVIITNVAGSVISSNAMLTMYPFIRSPFLGAVTFWGKDATFSVEAWGSEPLSYQWFQNGIRVMNATNQTLMLTSIQFTNAGLYSIVVNNTFGSVTNAPAQVVVNPAGVSLGMYPGVVVSGVVGYTYNIQATSDLTNTNSWTTVATLTLMLPVQLWVDTQVDALSPTNPHKYYKVVPGF